MMVGWTTWTQEQRDAWRAWRRSEEHKNRQRNRTNLFVKRNNIIKLSCVCGRPDVQMHHEDYERHLEVAFLCTKCHTAHHRGRLMCPFEVHDLRWLAVADTVAFA